MDKSYYESPFRDRTTGMGFIDHKIETSEEGGCVKRLLKFNGNLDPHMHTNTNFRFARVTEERWNRNYRMFVPDKEERDFGGYELYVK